MSEAAKVNLWLAGVLLLLTAAVAVLIVLSSINETDRARDRLAHLNEQVALCLTADGYPHLVDDPNSRLPRVYCDLGEDQ